MDRPCTVAEEQTWYSGCGEMHPLMGQGTCCGRAGRGPNGFDMENRETQDKQVQKQRLSERQLCYVKMRGKSRLARLENLESWALASQLQAVVTLSVRCCGRIFIQSVLMAT